MKFEERKRIAQSMLIEFLSSFSPPRALDDSQLASRISQLADAFGRRMPIDGDFAEAVQRVCQRVMDTHMSNTWPPQAAFVMAMPSRELSQFSSQETFTPKSEVDLITAKMATNEPVPEAALWGHISGRLPRDKLDAYRNASVKSWIDTLGHKAADAMRSKYGHIVAPYFPNQSNTQEV